MNTNPYQQDWRPSPQSWPPPPPPYPMANRRPVIVAAIVGAVAGLLLGLVIGGGVVFVLGASGVFDPKPLTYGPGGSIARFDLQAGQCAKGEVKAGRSYPAATALACSGRHDFEVYETASTPGPDVADARYPDPATWPPSPTITACSPSRPMWGAASTTAISTTPASSQAATPGTRATARSPARCGRSTATGSPARRRKATADEPGRHPTAHREVGSHRDGSAACQRSA
jgi:hypothetical protein